MKIRPQSTITAMSSLLLGKQRINYTMLMTPIDQEYSL